MKVLIIEDEAPAFRRLQKILEEVEPGVEIVDVIDSVEETVKWFNNHNVPDLVFMDIQLSDGISFEIFEQVSITKPVIFTTAFDEYTLKAFKVNSIDYLLKPINKDELTQSLRKYRQMKDSFGSSPPDLAELLSNIKLGEKQYKSRFLVKHGEQLLSIEAINIAFFQVHNGLTYIHTDQNMKFIIDHTLEDLQNQLDPQQFYRANRQFIVNIKHIKTTHKYHKGKLMVEPHHPSNEPILVSAEKATAFKHWLGNE